MEAERRRLATEQARLRIDPDFAAKKALAAKQEQNRQLIQVAQAFGGGGAGAAAALGTGAAAAGGPAGIALAAKALADAIKQAIVGGIKAVGQAGAAVAGLNTAAAGDSLTKAINMIPIFGDYLAAANQAFRGFIQGLDQTAMKLAPFSGALSTAQAMAQVRQIEGDIRRAQLLGPGLAKFVDQRSKFEQAGQDLLAEMLRPLIPLATAFMENVTEGLEWMTDELADSIDIIVASLMQTVQGIENMEKFFGLGGMLSGSLKQILKALQRNEEPLVNYMQDILKMQSSRRAGPQNEAARQREIADGLQRFRLNLPALQGL